MIKSAIKAFVFGFMGLSFSLVPLVAESAYILESMPNDTAAQAQNLDASFTNTPNALIEVDENGTLGLWHASVLGLSGDSTYDYYSFSVGTGDSPLGLNIPVSFDTDFAELSGLDTHLTLFGTDGSTVLATNDDAPFDGPGDWFSETLNSFMTYSFDASGVYFIRVGEYDDSDYGGVLEYNGFYNLNVASIPVPNSMILLFSGLTALVGIRKSVKTI